MRKFIRSKITKRFLGKNGAWTDQIESAAQFVYQWDAQAVVNYYKLQDVELYYLFGEREHPLYDFTVPISCRSLTPTLAS